MKKFYLIIVVFIVIILEALADPIQYRVKRQLQRNNNGFDSDSIVFVDSFEDFGRDRRPLKLKSTSISPIHTTTKKSTVDAAQTATTPSVTTTTSSAYRHCLDTCLTTSEYNPVCGSDNQTYFNKQKLDCANNCGANIKVLRTSACQA